MRTLSATLTTAQKVMGAVLCKIVLTNNGNTYTYGVNTTNRLLKVAHTEQQYSQTAEVLINNSNNVLTTLDLEGYQGVLSYGYTTGAGDEYSACAPLKVKSQELYSAEGVLVCQLNLYGLLDQLNEDRAKYVARPHKSNTQTVKDIINDIANLSHASFAHCTAFTVDWDSEDSLVDSFLPKDTYTISVGESRFAVIKKLLDYTKSVMRVEADGHLHIINPTVSGVVYDYEYNDTIAAGNHTFFNKVYRKRLVTPNKVTVRTPDGSDNYYTGSATDATSYALLPKEKFLILPVLSNAEATAIAEAYIQKAQQSQEKGQALAPLNCGQEAYDYVKITDSRESDNRVGNIGWLIRNYEPGRFDFRFGFGNILQASRIPEIQEQPYVTYAELDKIVGELYENLGVLFSIQENTISVLEQLFEDARLKRVTVSDSMTIPSEAA